MAIIRTVELCAGIAGFSSPYTEALAFVEIEASCRAVLRRHYPDALILNDVRTSGAHNLPQCDVLKFGFPCQDLSVAGKRAGLDGARSSLFYECTRIADELRPPLLIWENVPGLLSSRNGRDFLAVLVELERIGYCGAWRCLDAQYFGVAQRRRRIFGVFARNNIGARHCAEILSLTTRMPGHTQESRETRKDVAGTLAAGAHPGSYNGQDAYLGMLTPVSFAFQSGGDVRLSITENGTPAKQASQVYAVYGGNNTNGERAGDSALTSHAGRYDFDTENFVCGALSAAHGGPDDNSGQANHLVTVIKGAAIGRAPENGPQYGEVLDDGTTYTLNCTEVHAVQSATTGVRRLTPREYERLQGFDDDWTAWGVDEAGNRAVLSDSARYRALGNAVNRKVSAWLDSRIVQILI